MDRQVTSPTAPKREVLVLCDSGTGAGAKDTDADVRSKTEIAPMEVVARGEGVTDEFATDGSDGINRMNPKLAAGPVRDAIVQSAVIAQNVAGDFERTLSIDEQLS